MVPSAWFCEPDVPEDPDIDSEHYTDYLIEHFDKKGFDVLEVGSRRVTGSVLATRFKNANYTGFDYYEGENVDVVGDAHKLSSYFGDKKFDLIFSTAVFEHLAMPWRVSIEIIKLLKLGGYVFIGTHYSYKSHERPWHFFQFSEIALNVLFPEKFGIECVKKGCCNVLKSCFSQKASKHLRGDLVTGIYCSSAFLGRKNRNVDDLSWDNVTLEDVVGSTKYPAPQK